MDYEGGFHDVEIDGKLFLVYHNPKYLLIPSDKQGSTSAGEAINDDQLFQPLFLCPNGRSVLNAPPGFYFPENCRVSSSPLFSSPEYIYKSTSTREYGYHSVLPLFWCNNKEFDVDGGCNICSGSNFGTDYYFCDQCEEMFHKECVQSPPKIKHPYHADEHYFQLQYYIRSIFYIFECFCCGREAQVFVYCCKICQIFMHPICALKPLSFVINPPKRHAHPLTFFPRQTSLICNICGLLKNIYPTYICARCNFVAHKDCMNFPSIIKISRHHHRISYIYPLQSRERSCGVCRQITNSGYGAYTCGKCSDYVVHSRCAIGNNVWDGKELEDIQEEEDDITQAFRPFSVISERVIHYFLHDHHLQIMTFILYDESKFCQACRLPIYEGNFYSCIKCDFILHETCTHFPRRIDHALHSHPLILKSSTTRYNWDYVSCNACERNFGGFVYECPTRDCNFKLDVRCASVSEPFDYKIHEHPLFLAIDPKETPKCHVCKTIGYTPLNCIECNFIVCFRCATLPYTVRYKHDTHFLTFLYGEELCNNNWCQVCELNLGDTYKKVFYGCNECYATFHIECVLGEEPYCQRSGNSVIEILGKNYISRPSCSICGRRCQNKIYKRRNNDVACSINCSWRL